MSMYIYIYYIYNIDSLMTNLHTFKGDVGAWHTCRGIFR